MTTKKTKIIDRDNPVLRKKAEKVPLEDIKSAEIKNIIADMKDELAGQYDGIGLAAPQIGVPLRIFIVAEEALFDSMEIADEETQMQKSGEAAVYINPTFKKISKEKEYMEEGCLSLRWQYGKVRRSTKAAIEAYDENGRKFTRGASGLLAHIFQHEMDHLDGVLFIDKAKDVKDVPPSGEKTGGRPLTPKGKS